MRKYSFDSLTRGLVIGIISAVTALSVAKDGIPSNATSTRGVHRRMTQQERIALHERAVMRRTGGIVRKEDSAKGTLVILNAQAKVADGEFASLLDYLKNTIAVRSVLVQAEGVEVGNVVEKIKKANATIGVGVVEDAMLPTLLVAPESRWAIVNIAQLKEGCRDARTLSSRVRKEILRSLAFITGCAYTTMADPLMRDVTKPGDVDALQNEEFGLEIINRFTVSAPLYGLKPWYSATYKDACQEGWAPTPTNNYQKWIWEKAKAEKERGPSHPITIPPPPKAKK